MKKPSTPAATVKIPEPLPPLDSLMPNASIAWSDRERRIITAFSRLPCIDENALKSHAPGIARNLMVAAPSPKNDAGRQFRRRFETASESATRMEIAKVMAAAAKLASALGNMHAPAIAALNMDQGHFKTLETRIRLLKLQAKQAEIPTIAPSAGKGQPAKLSLKRFSDEVAFFYRLVTGRAPTVITNAGIASGPFMDLLGELFDILQISGSAESQARAAIKEFNRKK